MTFSAIQWHQGPSLVAQHLPALETLRVNTCGVLGQGAIDTSGCKRLRQLVVSDPVPQQLIWDTGSGPCPVAFELLNRNIYSCNGISYALKKQAGLPQHVIIDAQYHPYCADWTIRAVHGLLGAFSSMRVLTWKWAVHYNYYKARRPDEDEFHETADQYFASCMPLAGMPLVNLETIIITAHSMQWTFPRTCQLPNLRQLVVKASGRLQIEFREPIGTLLKLSSMHVFGRPYHPHGCDQLGLTEGASALAERGLVLGMASTEQHGCSGRPASCVDLRPVGTRELSIDELWTTVEQLAHCRCGACFDCLRRAGCIEGWCMLDVGPSCFRRPAAQTTFWRGSSALAVAQCADDEWQRKGQDRHSGACLSVCFKLVGSLITVEQIGVWAAGDSSSWNTEWGCACRVVSHTLVQEHCRLWCRDQSGATDQCTSSKTLTVSRRLDMDTCATGGM